VIYSYSVRIRVVEFTVDSLHYHITRGSDGSTDIEW